MSLDIIDSDDYSTIKEPKGPIEFKEKSSRFISFIYPIRSIEDSQQRLNALRKKYHSATHICYAFRIGEGAEEHIKYNDDGEPGNSAGLPIYNVIKHAGYYNVLLVVVRYFGGIKLGTGGLARAYGRSARLAVDAADRVNQTAMDEIAFFYPYDLTGDVMKIIKDFSLGIVSQDFIEEGIRIRLLAPKSKKEDLTKIFLDSSSGRVIF